MWEIRWIVCVRSRAISSNQLFCCWSRKNPANSEFRKITEKLEKRALQWHNGMSGMRGTAWWWTKGFKGLQERVTSAFDKRWQTGNSGKSCVLEQIVIHLKSEIEKNLKFTIEQNIVEINRLKALVDEANNKQKQEQFVRYHAGSFGVFALSNIYVRFSGFHLSCDEMSKLQYY